MILIAKTYTNGGNLITELTQTGAREYTVTMKFSTGEIHESIAFESLEIAKAYYNEIKEN
jgi:hypothetical protein